MTAMPERWRVLPGRPVKLASIDPSSTPAAPGGKAETLATLPAFHERLAGLQDRLWAAHDRPLLVLLQGLDASGQDGTIRHVFRRVNPPGTRVAPSKPPMASHTDPALLALL